MFKHLSTAAVLLMALSQPCAAALVTQTYGFSANGFFAVQGTGVAPVDPVAGSVTVTFETGESRFNQTSGAVLNSLDLPPPGSALAYTYQADLDRLIVGGVVFGAGGISPNLIIGGDDFFVVIDDATSDTPTLFEVAYVLVGHAGKVFASFEGQVSVGVNPDVDPPSIVPEPGALVSAFTGLLAAVTVRRRRRPS